MLNVLDALKPECNATVSASAGTGKTWMLTSRIIRLLLAGAEPGSILAITFTRKAAGEMRQRVYTRLHELAHCSTRQRGQLLKQIGLSATQAQQQQAAHLYWALLQNSDKVQITTFHAFFQQLLQRFPVEAEVPAHFELLKYSGPTLALAWDWLNQEATQNPQHTLAEQLEILFQRLGTLHSTKKTLFAFVAQRSDWWAYTQGHTHPVEWATAQLKEKLRLDPNPYQALYKKQAQLQLFAEQLQQRKANQITTRLLSAMGIATAQIAHEPSYFETLAAAFLTQNFTPRRYTHSKTLDKELGHEQAIQHIRLFDEICTCLLSTRDALLRLATFELNQAWYSVGQALLEFFQKAKRQQRQLDFVDLEWKTYCLLQHADHSQWIQYKLERRIDHFLFDEFQDTNPTQWQLLKPVLEELAFSDDDRQRSVFLVGDRKQSIYSFRRAEPALQEHACQWLAEHLNAKHYSLNASRRSSQTVIQAINQIFEQAVYQQTCGEFPKHATLQTTLWGRVEVPALFTATPISAPQSMRNPLQAPRINANRDHHYREGQFIARRIQALIEEGLPVASTGKAIQYSDIFILTRNRTHIAEYERALQEAEIPYAGSEKGSFLDNIEIQDMVTLLNFLVMPFDNHRLATILRSPLFHVSDQALMALAMAKNTQSWWQRLTHQVATDAADAKLIRAEKLISLWLNDFTQLPLHDLLDRIYFQGEVIERYTQAVKPEYAERAKANLTRLLELALDMDSGRYPSLIRFLEQLKRLANKDSTSDALDNAESPTEACVKLLTIHAAKGLEAPVVFLADTYAQAVAQRGYTPLITWPSQEKKPTHFMLAPPQNMLSELPSRWQQEHEQKAAQESLHLLYVGLTRAQHMLVITGNTPVETAKATLKKSWYEIVREGLQAQHGQQDELCIQEQLPAQTDKRATPKRQAQSNTSGFDWQSVPTTMQTLDILRPHQIDKPSPQTFSKIASEDGTQRGIYIHALLEQKTSVPFKQIAQTTLSETIRNDCEAEVDALLSNRSFDFIFSPMAYQTAKNEVSLSYFIDDKTQVKGVIDRLIIGDQFIWIIDYKSHRTTDASVLKNIAQHYQSQLNHYRRGIEKIYPDATVRTGILFTYSQTWFETGPNTAQL